MEVKLKVCRRSLTLCMTELTDLCNKVPANVNDIKVSVAALKDKNNRLESLNDEYDRTADHTDEQIYEEQLTKMETYRDSVARILATTDNLIAADHKASASFAQASNSSIRLPRLELPTFDGDVLKWHAFFEAFTNSVHSRNIPNVEKCSYLKQFLKGEAMNLVAGLAVTSANYDAAMELLCGRYGNEKRRMRAHVRELINTEQPNFKDSSLGAPKCSELLPNEALNQKSWI